MMKTFRNIQGVIILSILIAPVSCFAMLPVVDAGAIANLVKSYNQLKSQYDLLSKTYENQQLQLNQEKQLTDDSEGSYGSGAFMNDDSALKDREWSPDNWKNTLQGMSGGNPARYQELVNTYKQDHPTLSDSEYEKGASSDKAKAYSQEVKVNQAAQVNATYAFDNIKTHLDNIHKISEKIDTTENTKAAIDLNSRLLAEIAYIQTQELKMQILVNQQMVQVNADDIDEKTTGAKSNKLPDE